MANYNSVVQSIKSYEFGKKFLWLRIVHNKQWNKYLLDITRKYSYTKDAETKEGSCSTYLNLIAAKAVVDQHSLAYQLTKNFRTTKV